jgi:hypothetical protein
MRMRFKAKDSPTHDARFHHSTTNDEMMLMMMMMKKNEEECGKRSKTAKGKKNLK